MSSQNIPADPETAVSAKDWPENQMPPRVRRPLPWALLGAGAAAVGLVFLLIRRSRT
jgi:hypothetical protein